MVARMSHHCTNVEKKDLPKTSSVEVRAELAWETLSGYRTKAIAKVGAEISLDGFRKGHVPEALLVRHIGEGAILQEAADIAIGEELPLLLASLEIPAIAPPQVSVTKLAPGNPLGFTATIEVLPKVELPDYVKTAKKLGAGRREVSVDEKEVADVVSKLRRERARIASLEKGTEPAKAADEANALDEKDLPELDDAFVKGFGYENLPQFMEKLRENILRDKTEDAREKHRIAVIEAIAEKVAIAIPHSLIDHEVHKMEAQFAEDLARAGTTLDAYLAHVKKSHHDLHHEWHAPAEKRAKIQLILGEIAVKEGVSPDAEEVKKHVEHTRTHHKDIPEERVRAYYEHLLRNEAVLKWLEELK